MELTPAEALEVVRDLRRGVPPSRGLERMAVGLERVVEAIREQLEAVAGGQADLKLLRGEYGAGKTFAARLVAEVARARGFATTEVRITRDVPLHRLEAVYRSAVEHLSTPDTPSDAFRAVVDAWLYQVGDAVTAVQGLEEDDPAFQAAVEQKLEERLAELSAVVPAFAQALRAYHRATSAGDFATATGLLGWLGGQGQVGAEAKRAAGVSGKVDGPSALGFLRGVLLLIRQAGYAGLVLTVDELETVQRRGATDRTAAYEALQQLVDSLDGRTLPGLFLVVTGTRDLFEGLKGVKACAPLHQRIGTTFGDDPRFDNLRQPQVRLLPFDRPRLLEVARRVRAIYPAKAPERVRARVGDALVEALVDRVAGQFGGVSVTPRYFLRLLVDVLDRVDQHEGYDPAQALSLTVERGELAPEELDAFARARGEVPSAAQEPEPAAGEPAGGEPAAGAPAGGPAGGEPAGPARARRRLDG